MKDMEQMVANLKHAKLQKLNCHLQILSLHSKLQILFGRMFSANLVHFAKITSYYLLGMDEDLF